MQPLTLRESARLLSRIETIVRDESADLDKIALNCLLAQAQRLYEWHESHSSLIKFLTPNTKPIYDRIWVRFNPLEDFFDHELLENVFSYLRFNELQVALRVNRRWHIYASEARLRLGRKFGYTGDSSVAAGKNLYELKKGLLNLSRYVEFPLNMTVGHPWRIHREATLLKFKSMPWLFTSRDFPYMLARICIKGDRLAVKTLLYFGCDPNLIFENMLPIERAAKAGKLSVVNELLNHVKVTPVLIDILVKRLDEIKHLRTIKNIISYHEPTYFYTACKHAFLLPSPDVLLSLLEAVDRVGKERETILSRFLEKFGHLPEERLLVGVSELIRKGALIVYTLSFCKIIGHGHYHLLLSIPENQTLIPQELFNNEIALLMTNHSRSKVTLIIELLIKWGVVLSGDNQKYYEEVILGT